MPDPLQNSTASDSNAAEESFLDVPSAPVEAGAPINKAPQATLAAQNEAITADLTGDEPEGEEFFPIAKSAKVQVKPKTAAAKPAERDLSLFDDTEKVYAKQMSNDAFARFSELKKIIKDLESKVANPPQPTSGQVQSFYEHPEAYMLQPDYKEAEKAADDISDEYDAWLAQLTAVESGKPFKIVVRDANGKLTLSNEQYQPSSEVKVKLQEILHDTKFKLNEAEKNLASVKTTFANNFAQTNTLVDKGLADAFPWIKDPASYKDVVFEGPNIPKKTIEQLASDFSNLVPAMFRGSPMMKIATPLFASVHVLKSQCAKLQAENELLKAKNKEANGALPTSSGTSSGARKVAEGQLVDDITGL
jgi:hypothetical protein